MNRVPSPQLSGAVRGGRSIAKARKPVVLGVVGALVAGLLVVLAVRAEG